MNHHFSFKKVRIAVLGANGQLGQEFNFIAPSYEYLHFEFFSKVTLDIRDEEALKAAMNVGYDYVINCAAYTAVDLAETDAEKCYAINTDACRNIVNAIKGSTTKLVHFSSDYVYNSYNGFPIHEDDITDPQGVYASSKLEGEQIIRASEIPALILRTSWVISTFGSNFVKTMIRLGSERSALNVVNDQYGAPTYARHLAHAVLDIITQVEHNSDMLPAFNDTYNYANEGIVTWFDIADRIIKEHNFSCEVHPISTKDYPTKAKRPHWSVLSKRKIKERFNLEIPHWYTALKDCITGLE